jgi:hypothetical protein
MTTLNVRGELGRRVTVEIHGYEHEAAQESYDANWLRCSVEADIGRFRGQVDASFTTQDFVRFLSELEQVIALASSVASFQTHEEALALRIEVDRAGRATVSGKLREVDFKGPVLSFTFESDLSFLGELHAELRRVVSEFPERLFPIAGQ